MLTADALDDGEIGDRVADRGLLRLDYVRLSIV